MVSEEGCGYLSSALSSNPSHLRELDLSYNHPGQSGVQLLKHKLQDLNYKLQILKPARAAPSNPWLSDVLREHRTKLRAAERKWRKSNDPSDLNDPTVAAQTSGCLQDISAWMKEHHLQLNLAKTELLVFPATPTLQHDFTIQLGTSTITPSTSVRNLGVIFDDQLTFKEHIAKTARSCRFALHNIRKIRPFLTEHAAQLLVQALVISRLDYCNALLAGLPSNTIKPLQMIQNAAARLVFNEPKRAHVTPLFISLFLCKPAPGTVLYSFNNPAVLMSAAILHSLQVRVGLSATDLHFFGEI
ncbi:uncharacterized protein LOC131524461 isoform X1 [Onychostoma macrolepis]|uniref:uncharacterized protein LOC131524461 isoform X1 n=1 Tax=Onychostoma macrolepis TaxID=369639 RepID=UPI00272C0A72|nr:uncharacterized protein LOC131524461 isoform X1 [Onychostoma macrolepis]